jgi:hypothetical protein
MENVSARLPTLVRQTPGPLGVHGVLSLIQSLFPPLHEQR